jgi:hypothetical protein
MTTLKSLIAAAALATGLAGAAQAAPALNAAIGNQPATADSAVTQAYYGCVPVYRWVYGYYGWQQVYAGQRCPNYGYYGRPYSGPHGTFRYSSPGLRLRIGF